MVCIHCGQETRVVNSRPQKRSNQIWRRRQCTQCLAVFTTEERVDHAGSWTVRSGAHIAPFSRDKLFLSLYQSCKHRSAAIDDASGLTDTVINRLSQYVSDGSITNLELLRVITVVLNRFDKLASTHYQAFHKV